MTRRLLSLKTVVKTRLEVYISGAERIRKGNTHPQANTFHVSQSLAERVRNIQDIYMPLEYC